MLSNKYIKNKTIKIWGATVKLVLYMYNYNLGINVKLVNLVGLIYKFHYIIIIR
jgi:hypothetical protein